MKLSISIFVFLCSLNSFTQTDAETLKIIFNTSLTNGKTYAWLDYLSNEIGGRLSGSSNAEEAVQWTKSELEKIGLDKVWLQPVQVPKWVRGEKELAYFNTGTSKKQIVNICALDSSVATSSHGIQAEVIEVYGLNELKELDRKVVEGKIIFFNRPMNPTKIGTFEAYSNCADQRYAGAFEAGKLGAKGVIIRSMNLRLDNFPHTGSMTYKDLPVEQIIPSAAISTNDAELLSKALKQNKNLRFYFKQNCKQYNDVESFNVIGEITGTEFPNEIILVGGHLDSWDLGDGSHDNGVGCVQSMDVLRLLKESGIQPKRTIRAVFFMNEENGIRGGKKYAELAKVNNENHVFALESDSGGFTPIGFSLDCSDADFEQVQSWNNLFKPYLIHYFEKGHSGSDIGPLKSDSIMLAGLVPDSQRYFDYHQASNDTFDAVNKRELELGAATMTSLVYLVDKYDV